MPEELTKVGQEELTPHRSELAYFEERLTYAEERFAEDHDYYETKRGGFPSVRQQELEALQWIGLWLEKIRYHKAIIGFYVDGGSRPRGFWPGIDDEASDIRKCASRHPGEPW